jgi:hypothetical protein
VQVACKCKCILQSLLFNAYVSFYLQLILLLLRPLQRTSTSGQDLPENTYFYVMHDGRYYHNSKDFFIKKGIHSQQFCWRKLKENDYLNPTKNMILPFSYQNHVSSVNDIFPMINNVKQSVGKASRLGRNRWC